MEEYRKEIEEKIAELKSWRNSLASEVTRRTWTKRIGYFTAGYSIYKLFSSESTLLSNALGVGGFLMGRSAGRGIRNAKYNYNVASKMLEDKESELVRVKKLEEEKSKEKEKQLTLERA